MTDDQLLALGQIIVRYSQVEWAVSAFIWKLLSPDQQVGQTVTASLNFRARTALLRALFDLLEPAYGSQKVNTARLDQVLRQAENAVDKRNAVVHALSWLPDSEARDWRRMNLRPRSAAEWRSAPASATDLLNIANELADAWKAVSDCMFNHFEGFGVEDASGPMGAGSLFGLMATAAVAWQRGRES